MLIEVKDAADDESAGGAPLQDAPQDVPSPQIPVPEMPAKPAPKRAAAKPAKPTTKAATTPAKRPAKPIATKPVKIAIAGDETASSAGTTTSLTSGEVIRPIPKPTKREVIVSGHKSVNKNVNGVVPASSKPVKATIKGDVRPAKPVRKAIPNAVPGAALKTALQPAQLTQPQPTPPTQPVQPAPAVTSTPETAAPVVPSPAQPQPTTQNPPIPTEAPAAIPTQPAEQPLSTPPPTLRVPTNTTTKRDLSERIHHAWTHTRKRRIFAVLLVLFALYNGGVYVAYRDRAYPHTMVNGQLVGNQSAKDLPSTIAKLPLLPEKVILQYKNTRREITPAALGLSVDADQTSRSLLANRSWLPAYNLIKAPKGDVTISVEPKAYDKAIQQVGTQYRTKAIDARIELRNNEFRLVPQVDAQTIDTAGTQAAIVEALSAGRPSAMIHLRSQSPVTTTAKLQPAWQRLEAQRHTKITLTSGGKTREFSAAQVGSWFEPDASPNSFKLNKSRIPDTVVDASLELSVTPQDEDGVATKVADAVSNLRESRIAVTGSPISKRQYSFCTDVRGISPSELVAFTTKAETTLNDKRSWSLGGNITYKSVKTGCDFTIWLTAPEQMSSFGDICDSMWSCDVTPNVVINHDRWLKASVPWNKTFGTSKLEEYRSMAINHEVGHEMGFGHSKCPGPGQPAPVMEQQSIDLQGCVFNAWPTVQERVALKNFLRM